MQEEIASADEHAGVLREALGKRVADANVLQAQPVDVLLDEQLFADVRVVARLQRRNHDDRVDGRSGAVLLAVAQHAVDHARLLAVERALAESARRQVLLGRVEDVATLADVEQDAQRDALVPDSVRQADRVVGLAIVAVRR